MARRILVLAWCALALSTRAATADPSLVEADSGGEVHVEDAFRATRGETVADMIALYPETAGEVRIDGGRRLGGAPAMSLAFFDYVTLRRGAEEGAVVAGPGKTEVVTVSGNNQPAVALRGAAGSDGGQLAAMVGGPLRRDRAWGALGLDLRGDRTVDTAQAFGRLDVAFDHAGDHMLRVTGLWTAPGWPGVPGAPILVGPPLPALRGTTPPAEAADAWADATLRSRFDEGRRTVELGTTVERWGTRHREAARASVEQRLRSESGLRLRGEVEAAGGERREGHVAAVAVLDVSSWASIEGVVAGEHVDQGGRSLDAVLAHAGLSWDPSRERRARVFADVSRRADLEAMTAPVIELIAGGEREVVEHRLVLGAALRRHLGTDAEAWAIVRRGETTLGLEARAPLDDEATLRARAYLYHEHDLHRHGALRFGAVLEREGELRRASVAADWRSDGWHPRWGVGVDAHAADGGGVVGKVTLIAQW